MLRCDKEQSSFSSIGFACVDVLLFISPPPSTLSQVSSLCWLWQFTPEWPSHSLASALWTGAFRGPTSSAGWPSFWLFLQVFRILVNLSVTTLTVIDGSIKDETFAFLSVARFLSGVFQLCAYQRTTTEPAPSNNPDSWTRWAGRLQWTSALHWSTWNGINPNHKLVSFHWNSHQSTLFLNLFKKTFKNVISDFYCIWNMSLYQYIDKTMKSEKHLPLNAA